jgi:hypothetical protein
MQHIDEGFRFFAGSEQPDRFGEVVRSRLARLASLCCMLSWCPRGAQ